MTRLGQTILGLILIAIIGFASMLTFGSGARTAFEKEPKPPVPMIAPVAGARLAVPVAGVSPAALIDTWGQDRADGERTHEAIDIPAPGGTPVRAAAPGRVEKLFQSVAGGTTLYVRSPDAKWSYYYAHLAGYAPGIAEGTAVRTGTLLGYVGDTGNAGVGNTHLHFAVNRMGQADRWWQGEPINPYPLLAGGARAR